MSVPPLWRSSWGWSHFLFFRPLTFSFSFNSSTTLSNSSKRAPQSWRYLSIHAASSSSPRRPSLQVRTRPTFFVVTSPACSKMQIDRLGDAQVLIAAEDGGLRRFSGPHLSQTYGLQPR